MKKNITLSFITEDFTFYCNINLFIRALSNMVQNSIKYSDSNSEIKVIIRKEENNAVFIVENPGHIEDGEIGRIFNRLYRGRKRKDIRRDRTRTYYCICSCKTA